MNATTGSDCQYADSVPEGSFWACFLRHLPHRKKEMPADDVALLLRWSVRTAF